MTYWFRNGIDYKTLHLLCDIPGMMFSVVTINGIKVHKVVQMQ
jgi:hypothetical protein